MFSQEQIFQYAAIGDLDKLIQVHPTSLLSKPDATGVRPIHVASANGQTATVEWLVEDSKRDTGVNKADEDARTPLHWAAWHGKAETVKALLEMGAIRDRPTRTGYTPLHYACFAGDLDTVKILVEFGAKIDSRDESQQTPKDVAIRFEHFKVVEYMEKEAPIISGEARKKFANVDEDKVVLDPMVETMQVNEDMNLERIVYTATKVASENKHILVNKPKMRQRNLLLGIVIFTSTLFLGVIIGKRIK